MRAALAVNHVGLDREANLARITAAIGEAGERGADLVLLPEAAATGLINNGDPVHDLPLGQSIPGPATDLLADLSKECRIHVAIGLLERQGQVLYDSAVLLGPDGDIMLHYRRIQPQWHGRGADPEVYRQGTSVSAADTGLGRMAVILCGDLFDDAVLAQVQAAAPDWLLFPFARCFSDESYDQERWDREELPEYLARVRSAGCTTLMVNYLSGPEVGAYFGGAFAVSGRGEVIASLPLGRADTLLVDLAEPPG
jgi:predicted amidohydrolase